MNNLEVLLPLLQGAYPVHDATGRVVAILNLGAALPAGLYPFEAFQPQVLPPIQEENKP